MYTITNAFTIIILQLGISWYCSRCESRIVNCYFVRDKYYRQSYRRVTSNCTGVEKNVSKKTNLILEYNINNSRNCFFFVFSTKARYDRLHLSNRRAICVAADFVSRFSDLQSSLLYYAIVKPLGVWSSNNVVSSIASHYSTK